MCIALKAKQYFVTFSLKLRFYAGFTRVGGANPTDSCDPVAARAVGRQQGWKNLGFKRIFKIFRFLRFCLGFFLVFKLYIL